MNQRTHMLFLSLLGSLVAIFVVWVLLDMSSTLAWAEPVSLRPPAALQNTTVVTRYVSVAGSDTTTCTQPLSPCRTVQHAVDVAESGDLVLVAQGIYTASGANQVARITQSLTLRGGYTVTDWSVPNPVSYPTTLDAEGQGRVIYIAGGITVTIEDLHITGGNVNGKGGGLYAVGSVVTLNGNTIAGNAASNSYGDNGGGIYVSDVTLTMEQNEIAGNRAYEGGGLYAAQSVVTLTGNTIAENIALEGNGGGACFDHGQVTIQGNQVTSNTSDFRGGGVDLRDISGADVRDNVFIGNRSREDGGALNFDFCTGTVANNLMSANSARMGGGISHVGSTITILSNTISANAANSAGGVSFWASRSVFIDNTIISNTVSVMGGGVAGNSCEATFVNNDILSNTATNSGGLFLQICSVTFDGDVIAGNQADDTTGGLWLSLANSTMHNTTIVDNRASGEGAGLFVGGSYVHLFHTTLARNGSPAPSAEGTGIHVSNYAEMGESPMHSVLYLTNTIIVSHSVGITAAEATELHLEGTLWGNDLDWGGAGTITTGTVNLWVNPGFVDPDGGDYHLAPGSPAVDAGVASGVFADRDGDPRPAGLGFDLGADERPGSSLLLNKTASPRVLDPGETVTYSLVVTSTGISTTTNVVLTDTLPSLQRSLGLATTRGNCTAGAGWGSAVTCTLGTMVPGEGARVTVTAQVTTAHLPLPVLPVRMRNIAQATADETTTSASAVTILQDCNVRLNDDPTVYATVQAAIDASTQPTDTVRVAGACAQVHPRAGLTQVALISKTVTLQGGWNRTFTHRDVLSYPTTLDAFGQGRVLYITGTVAPLIQGLYITGGDAESLRGSMYGDAGGGILVREASITLRDSHVSGNRAQIGGGICLDGSGSTLSNSVIEENTADMFGIWATPGGGGVFNWGGTVTLTENVIVDNFSQYGGGGIQLEGGGAVLQGNRILSNTAAAGGGVYADAHVEFHGNVLSSNQAAEGGGLYLGYSSDASSLAENHFIENVGGNGGGIYLSSADEIDLANNVIARNQALLNGSGLYVRYGSAELAHTTIAQNDGGDGVGIYVADDGTARLFNTILVSQTVGAYAFGEGQVILNSTLWHGNGTDWAGDGTIDHINDVRGDPAFMNPAGGDYHIHFFSAAVDRGVDAGVAVDIDGEPRPIGLRADLGADEFPLPVQTLFFPIVTRKAP